MSRDAPRVFTRVVLDGPTFVLRVSGITLIDLLSLNTLLLSSKTLQMEYIRRRLVLLLNPQATVGNGQHGGESGDDTLASA